MQSFLMQPGVVAIRYRCNNCPNGCELTDFMGDRQKPVMHQHACHHFPSLMTAWERVA